MITGTTTGYNSTGSSTSRLRARTSIAANSVPTAAKPTVHVSTMPASQNGWANRRRGEEKRDERQQHALRCATSSATMPSSLPT